MCSNLSEWLPIASEVTEVNAKGGLQIKVFLCILCIMYVSVTTYRQKIERDR